MFIDLFFEVLELATDDNRKVFSDEEKLYFKWILLFSRRT